MDKVKETTQKIGDFIKESQPELAQLAIENTPNHQPIKKNEWRVYDVELEKTLKNMTGNSGFSKTYYDHEHGWMWKGYLLKCQMEQK